MEMSAVKQHSRLSVIKSNVNKVIELKQKASGRNLFAYVPDSIINHKNNQQGLPTGGSRARSSDHGSKIASLRNNGRTVGSRAVSCDDNIGGRSGSQ